MFWQRSSYNILDFQCISPNMLALCFMSPYYGSIMLHAFGYLLYCKLCQHNRPGPNHLGSRLLHSKIRIISCHNSVEFMTPLRLLSHLSSFLVDSTRTQSPIWTFDSAPVLSFCSLYRHWLPDMSSRLTF